MQINFLLILLYLLQSAEHSSFEIGSVWSVLRGLQPHSLASSYRAAPTSSLIGKTAVEQLGTLSLSEKKKR